MATKIELLKNFSDGCSKQSGIANQFWIALIITSIITITARPNGANLLELPFNLGEVNSLDFYTIILILICVLLIAFSSALIQSTRARKLFHNLIKSLTQEEKYIHGIHIQDIYDISLTPTFLRVAPISQCLFGKNQFLSNNSSANIFIKFFSVVLYIVLKSLAIFFTYFISILSLLKCYKIVNNSNIDANLLIPTWVLLCLICLTLFVILIPIIGDIGYSYRVIKSLYEK